MTTLTRTLTSFAALALAVVALGWGGGVSPSAAASSSCRLPAGAKQFAVNRYMRVYQRRPEKDSYPALEVCVFASGVDDTLEVPGEENVFRPPALRLQGPLLAYGVQIGPELGAGDIDHPDVVWETYISVFDARTRPDRFVRKVGPRRWMKIGSVVVTRRVDLAWIACPERRRPRNGEVPPQVADPHPTCVKPGSRDYVYRLPLGKQRPERLEAGRAIEPRSLEVHGRWITLRSGGEVRRARLG